MIELIITIAIVTYLILLMLSLTYSCGGWDKSCGLCWVGIIQAPLIAIDWMIDKIKETIKR